MIRRSQSAVLPTETKPVLDQQLSLPDKKSSVGGISAGEDDQFEDHPGMGLFKNSQAQGTFTTLGTQLPHSPLLQRQQHSSNFLNPLDCITDEQRSVSLPSSPRAHRRGAESLDTAKGVERKEVLAELIGASQKLRSMSLGCEETEVTREVSRVDVIIVFSKTNKNYHSTNNCTVKFHVF